MARSLRFFGGSTSTPNDVDLEASPGIWSEPEAGQAFNPFTNVQLLCGHTDIVRILVQIDDTMVATAGDDPVAIIWHTDIVRQHGVLKGHSRAITSMVVVPSRAAGSGDSSAGRASTGSGSGSAAASNAANNPKAARPRIITASVDKTIKVWSIEQCTQLHSFVDSDHAILRLLPLRDDLFCSAGKGMCVWNVEGNLLARYTSPDEDAEDIQDVILVSPFKVVTSSNDKKLVVYAIEGLAADSRFPGHSAHAAAAAAAAAAGGGGGSSKGSSRDDMGSKDAAAGNDDDATATNTDADRPTIKVEGVLEKHREDVSCIHKINDAEFASGSLDGTIVIWSSVTLEEVRVLNFKPVYQSPKTHKYVFSIQHLISFQDYLVAAMGDGFVVYNKDTGEQLACVRQAHRTIVTHLLVMDHGQWLITCSADAGIRLWSLAGIVQHGHAAVGSATSDVGMSSSSSSTGVSGFLDSIKLPGSPLKGIGGGSVKITGSASPSLFRTSTPPRPAGTSSPSVRTSSPSLFQRSGAIPRRFSGKTDKIPTLLGNLAAHSGSVNKLLACGGSQFLSCGSDQLVVLWRTDIVEWGRRNDISRALLKSV